MSDLECDDIAALYRLLVSIECAHMNGHKPTRLLLRSTLLTVEDIRRLIERLKKMHAEHPISKTAHQRIKG